MRHLKHPLLVLQTAAVLLVASTAFAQMEAAGIAKPMPIMMYRAVWTFLDSPAAAPLRAEYPELRQINDPGVGQSKNEALGLVAEAVREDFGVRLNRANEDRSLLRTSISERDANLARELRAAYRVARAGAVEQINRRAHAALQAFADRRITRSELEQHISALRNFSVYGAAAYDQAAYIAAHVIDAETEESAARLAAELQAGMRGDDLLAVDAVVATSGLSDPDRPLATRRLIAHRVGTERHDLTVARIVRAEIRPLPEEESGQPPILVAEGAFPDLWRDLSHIADTGSTAIPLILQDLVRRGQEIRIYFSYGDDGRQFRLTGRRHWEGWAWGTNLDDDPVADGAYGLYEQHDLAYVSSESLQLRMRAIQNQFAGRSVEIMFPNRVGQWRSALPPQGATDMLRMLLHDLGLRYYLDRGFTPVARTLHETHVRLLAAVRYLIEHQMRFLINAKGARRAIPAGIYPQSDWGNAVFGQRQAVLGLEYVKELFAAMERAGLEYIEGQWQQAPKQK